MKAYLLIALFALTCRPSFAEDASKRMIGTRPLPAMLADGFTIVIIPDTQSYVGKGCKATPASTDPVTNPNLEAQVKWIREQRDAQKIVFVSHVGDIVDKNNADQWAVAKQHLDTLRGVVPFSLTVGNHDMTAKGDAHLFQKHFPAASFAAYPWYLGSYTHTRADQNVSANNVNSAQLFSAGGVDFIHLSLECNAPDDVLAWANDMLARHAKRRALITTHMDLGIREKPKTAEGYIHDPKGRMNWIKIHGARGNTGVQMWEKLYRRHANLDLIFCGDQSRVTALKLVAPGDHSQSVTSMLSDYLSQPVLRLLRFVPAENRIHALTYDVVQQVLVDDTPHVHDITQHHFTLDIPLVAPGDDGGTVLESKRLRLGKPGEWEWETFKERPLDGERFERNFQAKVNTAQHTLRIWQRDVKLSWPVLLNGRRLDALVASEAALETLLAIPPGALRDGENSLTILAPPGLDDIEVGPVSIAPKPIDEVLSGATIEVAVTDEHSGNAMPCRLTLTRPDGTLQPLRAEPAGDVAVRVGVAYARDGKATLSLPPGDYVLHAGRGFEWSVERAALSLEAGELRRIGFKLRREVPTEGWIAADSHIHTFTHSGHGDAKIEERMLTIAGEGIELAIATDHNHHTDYAPAAASAGVANRFTPIIGNEVTTKHGHFNAFPIEPGARVVNHQQEDWSKLLPEIRATPGVKVVTLNHPRDTHHGFIPLGEVQFDPRTGRHGNADALDVDAMEVVTSGALQSDIHLLYRDWFALLNRGHRIAAIASSDSHDVNRFILGQGRTYVAAKDADPTKLDLDEVWRSYREGRLLVSLGLLAQLRVGDQFTVGDLATGLSDSIKVEATVFGPAWVRADHLALYANGRLIREQTIDDDHRAGEKARVAWQIPRPAHDAHLVAIATGPGVTEAFWEIPRPWQPKNKTLLPRVIGSTNPIWLDADGDGRFQSANAYALILLKQHTSNREKLREALKSYDEAVAIQVESLISATPE